MDSSITQFSNYLVTWGSTTIEKQNCLHVLFEWVRLASWTITGKDSIIQPSDAYLLLDLYEGTISDRALPTQKSGADLEYLIFLELEETTKVSCQLKEDRSHGLETNKGSSLAIRPFKTYANKMFKEPPQASKDKHMISFVLKSFSYLHL